MAAHAENLSEKLARWATDEPEMYRAYINSPTPKLAYTCSKWSWEYINGRYMMLERTVKVGVARYDTLSNLVDGAHIQCSKYNANLELVSFSQ